MRHNPKKVSESLYLGSEGGIEVKPGQCIREFELRARLVARVYGYIMGRRDEERGSGALSHKTVSAPGRAQGVNGGGVIASYQESLAGERRGPEPAGYDDVEQLQMADRVTSIVDVGRELRCIIFA